MAVRDFRKRYIAFLTEDTMSRKEMIYHLNRIGKEIGVRITLTVFEGDRGIVLVKHTEQKKTIDALNRYEKASIRTLKTSGTIKKAKMALDNAKMGDE